MEKVSDLAKIAFRKKLSKKKMNLARESKEREYPDLINLWHFHGDFYNIFLRDEKFFEINVHYQLKEGYFPPILTPTKVIEKRYNEKGLLEYKDIMYKNEKNPFNFESLKRINYNSPGSFFGEVSEI